MGLGSSEKRRRIYYLSPKVTRTEGATKIIDPRFVVAVAHPDGTKEKLPDERSVSGQLVRIGFGKYEWPKDSGQFEKTIIIYLMDNDDLYKIEANVKSNIIRGLMNSVAGTQRFGVMRLALRASSDGKNANLFVQNDGEKTTWKFDYEKDIKPLIKEVQDPQNRNKTIKAYFDVDDLLSRAWEETIPVVEEHAKKKGLSIDAPKPQEATQAASSEPSLQAEFDRQPDPSTASSSTVTDVDPLDDDLPF